MGGVEEALDAESARFLMAHLPPMPWPEVATKHDLELLEARMDTRFGVMEERMERGLANVRADLTLLISNQTRTMVIALITAFIAVSSLAFFR